MFEYTQLPETIRFDLPTWPGFYALIVPNPKRETWDFYLTHEHVGIIHDMGGYCYSNGPQTPEELCEMVHWMVNDYLPDFVKDCCTDRELEE